MSQTVLAFRPQRPNRFRMNAHVARAHSFLLNAPHVILFHPLDLRKAVNDRGPLNVFTYRVFFLGDGCSERALAAIIGIVCAESANDLAVAPAQVAVPTSDPRVDLLGAIGFPRDVWPDGLLKG